MSPIIEEMVAYTRDRTVGPALHRLRALLDKEDDLYVATVRILGWLRVRADWPDERLTLDTSKVFPRTLLSAIRAIPELDRMITFVDGEGDLSAAITDDERGRLLRYVRENYTPRFRV